MGIVQSILNYGLMFWGGSNKADTIFITQKRILRTILGLKPRTSCKPYFLSFNVLTLPSLYFLQLALFVKKNPSLFETNKDRYAADMSIVTRGQADLRHLITPPPFMKEAHYIEALRFFIEFQNILEIWKILNISKQQSWISSGTNDYTHLGKF